LNNSLPEPDCQSTVCQIVQKREECARAARARAGIQAALHRDNGPDIDRVVMRLLHERTVVPALDSLGLSGVNLARLIGLLRRHHGMILVVGPTGSGKTTTLASALSSLQSGEMNIIRCRHMESVTCTS
jgi:Tfp pilus assembly pilus retraction ATPase PilT